MKNIEQRQRLCFICVEKSEQNLKKLPCNCQKWVHEQCLQFQISKLCKYKSRYLYCCEDCFEVIQYKFRRRYKLKDIKQIEQNYSYSSGNYCSIFIVLVIFLFFLTLSVKSFQEGFINLSIENFWNGILYLVAFFPFLCIFMNSYPIRNPHEFLFKENREPFNIILDFK